MTPVTIIDPRHPLYGQAFPYTPLGEKIIHVQLPNGQRRLIPRSATDLADEDYKPTMNLPRISVRTILPIAQLVEAKLAVEEDQHEQSNKLAADRSDIRKTVPPSYPNSEALEAIVPPAAKTSGKTLGATHATDTALGSEKGGAGC